MSLFAPREYADALEDRWQLAADEADFDAATGTTRAEREADHADAVRDRQCDQDDDGTLSPEEPAPISEAT